MSGASGVLLAVVLLFFITVIVLCLPGWLIAAHDRSRTPRSVWVLAACEEGNGPAVIEVRGKLERAQITDCSCWHAHASCGKSCVRNLKGHSQALLKL